MDIPPLVLQKWFRWPVSATMLIFDIAVILIQIPFSPVPQLLYGIVAHHHSGHGPGQSPALG